MRPRDGIAVTAILLMASGLGPALASCSFTSPIQQGGLLAGQAGHLIAGPGSSVGGFFWELGLGHPEDGTGNDGEQAITGPPAGFDLPWLRRDLTPGPTIDWDWGASGTDGCLSAGAGSGVMAFYLLDDSIPQNYALLAVSGVPTIDGTPAHDLDRVRQAWGLFGNLVAMVPLDAGVLPRVTVTAEIDSDTVRADVSPLVFPGATFGLNLFTDQGLGDSYDGMVGTDGAFLMERIPGGGGETPVSGCPADTGCTGVTLRRGMEYCWEGEVDVLAGGGSCDRLGNACLSDADCGFCEFAPDVLPCMVGVPTECFGGAAGQCLPDTCVAPATFGPPIPVGGRCVRIAALGEPQDGDFVMDCDETTLLRGWDLEEVCDGVDNDCDLAADEALTTDADADGHSTADSCFGTKDDCDDLDPSVNPALGEVCDNKDNDCNTQIDEGFDQDGDGFTSCAMPAPDCDDGSSSVFPGNPEICDNTDNDCNGIVDEGLDGDGDGFTACALPQPDCDDADVTRFPGNPELCDGVDNDCDGALPNEEIDGDGDGLSPCAGDCDDLDPIRGGSAGEVNDGEDNSCPEDPGLGLVDELDPESGFHDGADTERYSWEAQPGATLYEVIQSSSPEFVTCTATTTADPFLDIPSVPGSDSVSYYLVRSLAPNAGSWGRSSGPLPAAERVVLCVLP